jgi:hypothetical protein
MGAPAWHSLDKGSELQGQTRVMTAERLRWYGDGLLTSSAGAPTEVGINIHTDDAYAQAEGLPAAIADGMLGANWLADMLLDYFGEHYITNSRLRVKFIKPVFVGQHMSPRGVVSDVIREEDRSTFQIELSLTDEEGTPRTVGEASVTVPNPATA